MAKDPTIYTDHILEAITNIETDTAGLDAAGFAADRRVRQLVERNLEIVSEASRRLPDTLKSGEPDIDWAAVAGIGNILRHDYFRTHPQVLWETCGRDLRPLKAAIDRIRQQLRSP